MKGILIMQISSRFTIAIHIFSCIYVFQEDTKVTSEFLAMSTNVNAVTIRNILGQLRKAELIEVTRGSGGASIAKPLEDITLLDIYKAVDSVENGNLFHFHERPNPECPVGKNIHNVLDVKLRQVQNAMEKELQTITLQEVIDDIDQWIN